MTPREMKRLRLLYRLHKAGMLGVYRRLQRERSLKALLDRELGAG